MSYTDKDIKAYKQALLAHNDLYDLGCFWAGGVHHRAKNEVLEYFKANPKEAFMFIDGKKYFRQGPPSYRMILNHLINGGKDTLYFSNSARFNRIICLVDIDATDTGQAQELAEYVASHFLEGQAIVDSSTNGIGRHLYFILDVEYVKRTRVNDVLKDFCNAVKNETGALFSQAHVCSIRGEPTIWQENRIIHRGSLVKFPYFHASRLLGLKAIPLALLADKAAARPHSIPPVREIANRGTAGLPPDSLEPAKSNVFEKRIGITDHVFTKDEYLEQIKQHITEATIAESNQRLAKARSSLITYQKLSDFVSMQLQNAFNFDHLGRDAIINLSRVLKEKGIIDWVVSKNPYTELLRLCVDAALLEVYEEYQRPTKHGQISDKNGRVRVIGPGVNLGFEVYAEYQEHRKAKAGAARRVG